MADLIAVALALVDARTPRSLRDPAAALAYARRATAAEAKNAFAFEALARALEATGAAGAAAAAMETAVSLLGAGDTRRGAWSERLARLKAAAR